MIRLRWFVFGAVFFTACAAANIQFPYKWFYVSPITIWNIDSGKLIGAKPEDDRQLTDCKPIKNAEGKMVQKCAVVFLDELEKLIIDYKQSKQRIIDLEKKCPAKLLTIEN